MTRRDLYLLHRACEERASDGYRRGHVTAGWFQYDACLAAIAAYAVELGEGPPRPRLRRRPTLIERLSRGARHAVRAASTARQACRREPVPMRPA
jgi:hypothetical protein